MRFLRLVITVFAATAVYVGANPACAGLISFSYNFGAPNLGANQTIKQLDVGVTEVFSSVTAMRLSCEWMGRPRGLG